MNLGEPISSIIVCRQTGKLIFLFHRCKPCTNLGHRHSSHSSRTDGRNVTARMTKNISRRGKKTEKTTRTLRHRWTCSPAGITTHNYTHGTIFWKQLTTTIASQAAARCLTCGTSTSRKQHMCDPFESTCSQTRSRSPT